MKEYRFIDADSHVLEPPQLWRERLEPEFQDVAPSHVCEYVGDPPRFDFTVRVGGTTMPNFTEGRGQPMLALRDAYGEYISRGFDSESYVIAMDRVGFDYMALFPTAALFTSSAPGLGALAAAAYRRAYNNWLSDFCSRDRRLLGAGMIDLRDPIEAAREARRCVRELGLKAIAINPDPVTDIALVDLAYDVLWAEIAALDVPIGVHGSVGTHRQVGQEYFPNWGAARGICAHTMGNMLACVAFIGGGILERHPSLKVAFLESGAGWVPFWLDRIEAGVAGGNRGFKGSKLSASEYFKRQCYISADSNDPGIEWVVASLGDGHIVIGADFGHPEGRGYLDAKTNILGLPGLSDDTKRKVMWDNAAVLYGVEL